MTRSKVAGEARVVSRRCLPRDRQDGVVVLALREEKLYQRVTRTLEDDILSGIIREGEPVPSTNQYAAFFRINPATAAKGVGQLAERGLLLHKRGLGMFVEAGAREKLIRTRKASFRDTYLDPMLAEAKRLGISRKDLVAMVISAEK